jgi:hypothetical protein
MISLKINTRQRRVAGISGNARPMIALQKKAGLRRTRRQPSTERLLELIRQQNAPDEIQFQI